MITGPYCVVCDIQFGSFIGLSNHRRGSIHADHQALVGAVPEPAPAAPPAAAAPPPPPALITPGICRSCSCTEDTACLLSDGSACHWVEPDLCSACADIRDMHAGLVPSSEHGDGDLATAELLDLVPEPPDPLEQLRRRNHLLERAVWDLLSAIAAYTHGSRAYGELIHVQTLYGGLVPAEPAP